MASKAFGSQKRPAGKEFRDGTVGEALDEVYKDVDAGFANLEQPLIADSAEVGGNEAANEASIIAHAAKINEILVALKAAGIVAEA
jgi:hypothetical protein